MAAVLFDFSGTLFRVEPAESWLRAVLDDAELTLDERELAEKARALEEAGALPGGASPVRLPEELAGLWEVRDRSAGPCTPPSPARFRCPTRGCTTRCTTGT